MLVGWTPVTGPYCKWINVLCDSAGNVVRLTLSFLGLDGTLPPAAALVDLPRLEVRHWGYSGGVWARQGGVIDA